MIKREEVIMKTLLFIALIVSVIELLSGELNESGTRSLIKAAKSVTLVNKAY